MRQILIFLVVVFSCNTAFSQNSVEKILTEIEKNNTTLAALRKQVEAEQKGNKTGIYLQNPEVEFHYLWGSPSEISNRVDVSINQSFDFPTVYSYRNQISDLKNEQVELEYRKQLKNVLLEAKQKCFEMIYFNALNAELSRRISHARQIAYSYKKQLDAGEANILEYNKAQLNLLNTKKELESNEIERNALLTELATLNGGLQVEINDSIFQVPNVPADFNSWLNHAEQANPVLAWLNKETEISRKQESLNKALGLPRFQAGYMSEAVTNEQFQGVTVGVSIPLWENKNKVKYAAANTVAIESAESDSKLQFYNHLKKLYTKVVALQELSSGYRTELTSYDNTGYLITALDKGEISLIDYTMELTFYYQSIEKLLQTELELNKTYAELTKFL